MHIYEGILSVTPHGQELLAAGALIAAAGTAIGLRKLDPSACLGPACLAPCFSWPPWFKCLLAPVRCI